MPVSLCWLEYGPGPVVAVIQRPVLPCCDGLPTDCSKGTQSGTVATRISSRTAAAHVQRSGGHASRGMLWDGVYHFGRRWPSASPFPFVVGQGRTRWGDSGGEICGFVKPLSEGVPKSPPHRRRSWEHLGLCIVCTLHTAHCAVCTLHVAHSWAKLVGASQQVWGHVWRHPLLNPLSVPKWPLGFLGVVSGPKWVKDGSIWTYNDVVEQPKWSGHPSNNTSGAHVGPQNNSC